MSGGSHNYLCFADNLWDREEDLRHMADRLIELGYAEEAANETIATLFDLQMAKASLNEQISRLHKVWKAVEWMDSGDSGEDQLKAVLKEYDKSKS